VDRSLWHRDEIDTGIDLVTDLAPGDGYVEELRLQGLIAIEHGRARAATTTDWPAIAGLYGQLEDLTKSPIVRLNRAVAVAETDGAPAGLAMLDGLDDALATNHRLHAVRADLARRAGDLEMARDSYTNAMHLCANETEREYLAARLSALDTMSTES